MEILGLSDLLIVQVRSPESVVGGGVVQKAPVAARRRDHHRIRGSLLRRHDEPGLAAQLPVTLHNELCKEIVPHLCHQGDIRAEFMQGQPRVRHGASRGKLGADYIYKLARPDPVSQGPPAALSLRKGGGHIQGHMSRRDHFWMLHPFSSLCSPTVMLFRRKAVFLPPPEKAWREWLPAFPR